MTNFAFLYPGRRSSRISPVRVSDRFLCLKSWPATMISIFRRRYSCGAASFCFAELYVHVAMLRRSDPRWRCRCGSINRSVTSGISQCTSNPRSLDRRVFSMRKNWKYGVHPHTGSRVRISFLGWY